MPGDEAERVGSTPQGPDRAATTATQDFYGRWAGLYDRIATLPPVEGWRERVVAALDLTPGDTVVEMGCGTGANLPHLRGQVGPSGTVVGLDLAGGPLRSASRRVRAAGWQNVAVCQADATSVPITPPVDAVLGTFVVGMLPAPAGTVGEWVTLLRPGGRVALMDAVPTDRRAAQPLNLPFAAFVWVSAPVKGRRPGRPSRELASRVAAARHTLRRECDEVVTDSFALGFLHTISGTRPPDGDGTVG